MKCCANGCASLCLAPAPSLLASTSKPGAPSSNATSGPEALRFPERTKAGACPREKRHSPGRRNCSEKCTVDDDCPGAKKCCSLTECGRVCHSPTEASPPGRSTTGSTVGPQGPNPCASNPCLPFEKCTPKPATGSQGASHTCEAMDHFAAFDPCKNGKHTCSSEEHCIYEPQLCLTGPCSQYRCSPSPPPGFRRKVGDGSSNVKRRAELAPADPLHDPCSFNPCRPCQRCVPVDPASDEGKQLSGDSKFFEYRCESE